jgi:hypothetical protein
MMPLIPDLLSDRPEPHARGCAGAGGGRGHAHAPAGSGEGRAGGLGASAGSDTDAAAGCYAAHISFLAGVAYISSFLVLRHPRCHSAVNTAAEALCAALAGWTLARRTAAPACLRIHTRRRVSEVPCLRCAAGDAWPDAAWSEWVGVPGVPDRCARGDRALLGQLASKSPPKNAFARRLAVWPLRSSPCK